MEKRIKSFELSLENDDSLSVFNKRLEEINRTFSVDIGIIRKRILKRKKVLALRLGIVFQDSVLSNNDNQEDGNNLAQCSYCNLYVPREYWLAKRSGVEMNIALTEDSLDVYYCPVCRGELEKDTSYHGFNS